MMRRMEWADRDGITEKSRVHFFNFSPHYYFHESIIVLGSLLSLTTCGAISKHTKHSFCPPLCIRQYNKAKQSVLTYVVARYINTSLAHSISGARETEIAADYELLGDSIWLRVFSFGFLQKIQNQT